MKMDHNSYYKQGFSPQPIISNSARKSRTENNRSPNEMELAEKDIFKNNYYIQPDSPSILNFSV